jgi:hypothetical protein
VHLDDGSTAICRADEGKFERIGVPNSPRLSHCAASETGTSHPVVGNPGHQGDVNQIARQARLPTGRRDRCGIGLGRHRGDRCSAAALRWGADPAGTARRRWEDRGRSTKCETSRGGHFTKCGRSSGTARPGGTPPDAAAKPAAPTPAPASTVGTRFALSADSLPAPNTTPPNDIDPIGVTRPSGLLPRAPKGFSVSLFAAGAGNARWLAVAPNGDVFLAASANGKIMMLRDTKGNGVADTITTFAAGFSKPHGMAFHDGAFYVADQRAVWRLPYRDGDTVLKGEPKRVTMAPDLRLTGHWTREITFDSKGRLYLAIGCIGDVADDEPPLSATVQEVKADGTMTTFASGLRNVVGMAVHPGTDELWGTVNERDKLGGGLPPIIWRISARVISSAGPLPMSARTRIRSTAASAPIWWRRPGHPRFCSSRIRRRSPSSSTMASNFPPNTRATPSSRFTRPALTTLPTASRSCASGSPTECRSAATRISSTASCSPTPLHRRCGGRRRGSDGSLLIADESSVWRVAYTGVYREMSLD